MRLAVLEEAFTVTIVPEASFTVSLLSPPVTISVWAIPREFEQKVE
jgi:hypothetical protein